MTVVHGAVLTLDAEQLDAVHRRHLGPARLTGAAGTGKTLVALHRLARLAVRAGRLDRALGPHGADAADRAGGRLLYLTRSPGLARSKAVAYRQLAPATSGRVDFRALDEWTEDLALRYGITTGAEIAGAPGYGYVVVDEAPQLPATALRLVHALGRGRLLLLDSARDGRYLGDAGISTADRSHRLLVNYRNSAAVLAAARRFGDGPPGSAGPTGRRGGTVLRHLASCPDEQDAELIGALRACPFPAGDIALLVSGAARSAYYRRVLATAQIPAVALADHPGQRVEAVQVGTVEQSHGLEFPAVFLPDVGARPATELHAAVLRAREYLWTGTVRDHHGR